MRNLQGVDDTNSPRLINERQAREAIANGEFGKEVIASQEYVATILTQSWCLEWIHLNQSLEPLKQKYEYEIDVYELEYEKVDYFDDFLRFKENTSRNDLVFYIVYYTGGKLVGEKNYISVNDFLLMFNLAS